MRKHFFGFLVLIMVLVAFPALALADTLPVPDPEIGFPCFSFLLQDEDTIHVLSYYSNTAPSPADLPDDMSYISYLTYQSVCYELTDDSFIPCTKHCADIAGDPSTVYSIYDNEPILATSIYDCHTYCLTCEGKLYRWTPDADTPWAFVMALDQSITDLLEDRQLTAFQVRGDTLVLSPNSHLLTEDGSSYIPSTSLYVIDIPTGETRVLGKYANISSISPGRGNEFFLRIQDKPKAFYIDYVLDTVSGKMEKIDFPFDAAASLLRPCAQGWYYIGAEGLWLYREDGTQTMLKSMPGFSIGSRIPFAITPDETTLYYLYDTDLHRVSMLPTDDLTMVGKTDDMNPLLHYVPDLTPFYSSHDNLSLLTMGYPKKFDEIAQQLLLGSDTFDFMILSVQDSHLPSLKAKGYFHDLSGVASVRSYMDSLLPPLREACMVDDRVAALPLSMQSYALLINRDLWEELALGEMPTTYAELLDVIEACFDTGILNEYRLLADTRTRTATFDQLMYELLRQYIAVKTRQGGELVCSDEAFITLLDRLSAMRKNLTQLDRKHVKGDALFWLAHASAVTSFDLVEDQDSFVPLLLRMDSEQDPAFPVLLTAILVNPHTRHPELAEEMLGYIAAHPTAYMRCVMTREKPACVEIDNSTRASMEENLRQLEALYASAKDEHDPDTMAMLEKELANVRHDLEVTTYEVTPRAMSVYNALSDYLVVLDGDGYGFVLKQGAKALKSFSTGAIDARTLCQRLDQMLEMQRMEN